jgi:4-hydroxy-3-methylbut-2-enyl diphosphate reductase
MAARTARLKIDRARSAGFCSGVRRALELALKTGRARARVAMLGDIVHNEDVCRTVRESGIRTIRRLAPARGTVLILRAHGTPRRIVERAVSLGYTIVDATCPMVRHIHAIARRMETAGRRIIIIGDKRHDEVTGILGQLRRPALVIDSTSAIPAGLRIARAAVVVQSTQRLETALAILEALKKKIPDLVFFNTICRPTRVKQREIQLMPQQNDLMLIIGSRSSANTRRLYEIARSLNPRSYWVCSSRDIKKRWFKDARSVGVTAGASTPDTTIAEVIAFLRRL